MSVLNGEIDKLPVWAKAITVIGFPSFVAIFLLVQSAGWIPSRLDDIADTMQTQAISVETHVKDSHDLTKAVKQAVRIMCLNAAKDPIQRRSCETIE